MATVSKWTPFGVALDITATSASVTRTSATQYTVKINVSWETYYSGAQTNYGMTATSSGVTTTISAFNGTKRSSGSGTLTATYSISGNGSATKTISVAFKNFNTDNGDSATKYVSFSVNVPAWTSYTIKYNANGGTGAPSSQTKWKDQTLTLSSTKPTRTGYSFLGWHTSSTANAASYAAGATFTTNAATTLYAVWKANTYTVKYDANGGAGAPGSQTKTYGVALTLSTTKPTRTNYTFKGWGTSAGATTVSYAAGGTYNSNANTTLYAIWELSYKKPTISNLKVSRCGNDGVLAEDGKYALIEFKWSSYLTPTAITASWVYSSGEAGKSFDLPIEISTTTSNGTSGQVSYKLSRSNVISPGFDPESSYIFTVTVTDDGGSTSRNFTSTGTAYHLDYSEHSVAVGKAAETLLDSNGNAVKTFDVNWLAKMRNHTCIGEKVGHLDGKEGIFLSKEGYIQLQRTTAQGYHPYISFMLDDATAAAGMIRLNCSSQEMEFISALAYVFANHIKFSSNNKSIYGVDQNGATKNCFTPQNANGNTIVGYGNYTANSGNTNVYGKDVMFGISNVASGAETYYPYFRKGNSTELKNVLHLTGWITSSGTEVYFTVPFAKPIIGSPTVAITSVDGFKLRQNDKYTHGSSADNWVLPTSYTAIVVSNHGIGIKAVFSNTTNCLNNAPIGIQWSGKITFS